MSQELTQAHLDDARQRGFVNHCVQQGISPEETQQVVEQVYAPLAEQRDSTLKSIAETIISPSGN